MIDILYKTKEALRTIPNSRIKDVLARRFGIINGQRETLESIGQGYGITRERVRQIEEDGLGRLRDSGVVKELSLAFDFIQKYLMTYGDLRRENKIFEDLYQTIRKIKEPIEILPPSQRKDFLKHQGAFLLVLVLGPSFSRFAEDEKFFSGWTINDESLERAEGLISFLIDYLLDKKQVASGDELYSVAKQKQSNISDRAVFSYVDASKDIFENRFREYGLVDWPEINPRGVKDRAYLVLKKEGRPLHFREITDLINELIGEKKPAYLQTIHNELIKDPRFVLIGRGIYALAEWGYQPGTVLDMIRALIEEEGAQTKDEILKKVLEKRLVKENTVLINLQNRNYFVRGENGKYRRKGL